MTRQQPDGVAGMPDLTPAAERLLRWLHHHRGDLIGEEMLQAALDDGAIPDQNEFGRALLELARETYIRFEMAGREW